MQPCALNSSHLKQSVILLITSALCIADRFMCVAFNNKLHPTDHIRNQYKICTLNYTKLAKAFPLSSSKAEERYYAEINALLQTNKRYYWEKMAVVCIYPISFYDCRLVIDHFFVKNSVLNIIKRHRHGTNILLYYNGETCKYISYLTYSLRVESNIIFQLHSGMPNLRSTITTFQK